MCKSGENAEHESARERQGPELTRKRAARGPQAVAFMDHLVV
jgi:hypothetical protein